MAGWSSPQLGDVHHLGKIHFEQGPLAKAQGDGVLRTFFRFDAPKLGQLLDGTRSRLHVCVVFLRSSGSVYVLRRVVTVLRGKFLPDLDAPPMAMHIAEAADVHQYVEPELLAGTECAQHFIVLAAMAQSEINDLTANDFTCGCDCLTNLPVRVMTVFVDQRRSQLDFERLFVKQIDQGRGRDWDVPHQFAGHSPQLTPRLNLVPIRVGILHQRRRYAHFPQQFRLGFGREVGRHGANLLDQLAQRFLIHVVRGGSRSLL